MATCPLSFAPIPDEEIATTLDQAAADIDAAADLIADEGLCRDAFYSAASHARCPLGALSEVVTARLGTACDYVADADLIYAWMADHRMPPMTRWVAPATCRDKDHAAALMHVIAADVRLGLIGSGN
jgi:hypothetical protein